jgi:cell division protein FtsQ
MESFDTSQKKDHSLWYGIVCILLIGFVLTAYRYLDYQNEFIVKKIFISGNHELNQDDVIQMSGLKYGMDIKDVELTEASFRLMNSPYIWNARISRIFPNTLSVTVYEREPVAKINLEQTYALDKFGAILPESKQARALPLLSGIQTVEDFKMGYSSADLLIRQGIDLIMQSQVRYPNTLGALSEAHWDAGSESWILILDSAKPHINVGNLDLRNKLAILHTFIENEQKMGKTIKQLSYIDLRFDEQLIVGRRS